MNVVKLLKNKFKIIDDYQLKLLIIFFVLILSALPFYYLYFVRDYLSTGYDTAYYIIKAKIFNNFGIRDLISMSQDEILSIRVFYSTYLAYFQKVVGVDYFSAQKIMHYLIAVFLSSSTSFFVYKVFKKSFFYFISGYLVSFFSLSVVMYGEQFFDNITGIIFLLASLTLSLTDSKRYRYLSIITVIGLAFSHREMFILFIAILFLTETFLAFRLVVPIIVVGIPMFLFFLINSNFNGNFTPYANYTLTAFTTMTPFWPKLKQFTSGFSNLLVPFEILGLIYLFLVKKERKEMYLFSWILVAVLAVFYFLFFNSGVPAERFELLFPLPILAILGFNFFFDSKLSNKNSLSISILIIMVFLSIIRGTNMRITAGTLYPAEAQVSLKELNNHLDSGTVVTNERLEWNKYVNFAHLFPNYLRASSDGGFVKKADWIYAGDPYFLKNGMTSDYVMDLLDLLKNANEETVNRANDFNKALIIKGFSPNLYESYKGVGKEVGSGILEVNLNNFHKQPINDFEENNDPDFIESTNVRSGSKSLKLEPKKVFSFNLNSKGLDNWQFLDFWVYKPRNTNTSLKIKLYNDEDLIAETRASAFFEDWNLVHLPINKFDNLKDDWKNVNRIEFFQIPDSSNPTILLDKLEVSTFGGNNDS